MPLYGFALCLLALVATPPRSKRSKLSIHSEVLSREEIRRLNTPEWLAYVTRSSGTAGLPLVLQVGANDHDEAGHGDDGAKLAIAQGWQAVLG